ncbi:MAG: DinB family protein [Acidobacteriota bacterium]|nr:DinB family protein [Acidobacteriota bacterium]
MNIDLEKLRREIQDAAADMSEADWRRAPVGRWSSAQIVEHLGRTYGTTAKMIELAVASSGAPAPVRPARLKELLVRLVVVELGFFPSGLDAPEVVVPRGEMAPEQALQKALAALERMSAAIDTAVERWGSGPIAMHMILGPLNARQWCRFHYIHGHHHVAQIKLRSRKPRNEAVFQRAF